MEKAVLRKGNLYNPLTKKIDKLLRDSDQYDLEITIGGKSSYYRVRYNDSFFGAREEKPKSFMIHQHNQNPIRPEEASSFTRTRVFREKYQEEKIFPEIESRTKDAYTAFLKRNREDQGVLWFRQVYSFTLPSLGEREKIDVSHYDIDIELAGNKYYVVLITEKVNKYGLQRRNPLYMIYEKKDFQQMKQELNMKVMNIAMKEGYPLKLLEYVYIAVGGNYKLLSEFFNILKSTKSVEEALENELFKKIISTNEEVREELIKYLNGEQDDINYSYRKK